MSNENREPWEIEAEQRRTDADEAWQRNNKSDLDQAEAKRREVATQAEWDRLAAPTVNNSRAERITAILAREPHRRATDPDVLAEAGADEDKGDSQAHQGTRGDRVDRRDAGITIDSRDDADDADCLVLDGIKYRRAWFGSDEEIRALHARSRGSR